MYRSQWILFGCLLLATYLGLVIQEFIPPLSIFWDARIFLLPLLFCLGALELPFYFMIALAVFVGLLSDLSTLQIINGQVEIAVGWSIIFYVFVGSALQGIRPLYLRGHWELYAFGSALCTILLIACQFLMLSFRRMETGGLIFDWIIVARILVPGSAALLISPLIYMTVRACGLCQPPRRRRTYA